ncbi:MULTISPECIES: conjugal transfer protein [Oceanobacillus]|uniref:conjugal transfer protein n=1 Tax=Oceanobacillus TaxID=182709 RepID=UPI0005958F85|nr:MULTISPECIES: conjugal transfer protein [Oceanobacillus]
MKKKKWSTKIKNGFTFLKRASKTKKPKKERVKKPRAYTFRKIGAVTFWILFIFMFLVVLINVISSSSSNASFDEQEGEAFELNSTTQPEAIQFAMDFTRQYFTWDKDDLEDRDLRLQLYLALGVEPRNIDLVGSGWNATYNSSSLKEIREISANKSHIILSINATLDREVETGSGKNASSENESERLEKYIAVPVAFDGESFGVYSTPYFTNVENEITVANTGMTEDLEGLDSENREEETNISNFLPTFFESYASDTQDILAYVLDDPDAIGMNGEMNFVEVISSDVFQGREDNEFIVASTVTFEEPATLVTFDFEYLLLIQKEGNRYIISSMNAEPVIEEMTGYTIETESEIDKETIEELEEDENEEQETEVEEDGDISGE